MQNVEALCAEVHLLRTKLAAVMEARDNELHFFELSLDMLCTASLDTGHFVRLNPIWSRTLGFTQDELKAQPFIEFVHPDDRASTIAAASELVTAKDVVLFTNRYRTKSDGYRWIEWMSTVSLEHRLIYAVARDVTARQEAEEALRQSEQRSHELLSRLQEQNAQLRRQSEILRELATPVIPLADQVIFMPLIGDIDPKRADQVVENLARGVRYSHARVALLDLTGVRQIDTHGATALLRAMQVTKLLGSVMVLTGIRPIIAQTMTEFGIDLSSLVTYRALQEGIDFAFRLVQEERVERRDPRQSPSRAMSK